MKQSLFTLWTADLMLEREGKTHAHTPYARLVGEKRAGHGRAGRGLEARIRYYYYCGIRALATTHLGGLSEVKARLAVSCRVSLFVGYLPFMCHSMFAYTDSVAKSLYKHALTVNAHTACKYFTNIIRSLKEEQKIYDRMLRKFALRSIKYFLLDLPIGK